MLPGAGGCVSRQKMFLHQAEDLTVVRTVVPGVASRVGQRGSVLQTLTQLPKIKEK